MQLNSLPALGQILTVDVLARQAKGSSVWTKQLWGYYCANDDAILTREMMWSMGMKVLLTGSRGYIGSVMAPMLQAAGYEVVGMDVDLYRRCTFSAGGAIPEIPTVLKDMRDVSSDDLTGFDAVIHLAAMSNDPLSDLNPQLTYDINHEASVRLARMAKASS